MAKKFIRLWTVFKSTATNAAIIFLTLNRQQTTDNETSDRGSLYLRQSFLSWTGQHFTQLLPLAVTFAFGEKRQTRIFSREEAIPSQVRTRKQQGYMPGKRCESVLEVRVWKFLPHQEQPSHPTPPGPVRLSPQARKTPALLQLEAAVLTSDPREPQLLNRKGKIWT